MSTCLELEDGRRRIAIPLDEIMWIEAAGNYVDIHGLRRDDLVRHTLKAIEAKLDPTRFVRIRPSAIVRLAAIVEIERLIAGDFVVTLLDGRQIRSSRSYRHRMQPLWHAFRQGPSMRDESAGSASAQQVSAQTPPAPAQGAPAQAVQHQSA